MIESSESSIAVCRVVNFERSNLESYKTIVYAKPAIVVMDVEARWKAINCALSTDGPNDAKDLTAGHIITSEIRAVLSSVVVLSKGNTT